MVEATENEGVDLSNEFKNPATSEVVFRLYRIVGFVPLAMSVDDRPVPIYDEATFERDYTKVDPVFKIRITWDSEITIEMARPFKDGKVSTTFFDDFHYVSKKCQAQALELTKNYCNLDLGLKNV